MPGLHRVKRLLYGTGTILPSYVGPTFADFFDLGVRKTACSHTAREDNNVQKRTL
jgi:hypothetical protein